jgi:apolipoprotein N-acyltransferase
MQRITKSFWIGPIVSGILTFIAVCQINFLTSWICFIPLFISIVGSTGKNTFKKGLVFGFVFSIAAFFWMIPGAERFTGNSIVYGIGVFLISAVFISAIYAGLLYCFAALRRSCDAPVSILINSILIASVFCVGEALLSIVSASFPWFDIHAGNGLAANSYSIQPASLFGIHILTFVVVLANYLFASFIVKGPVVKLYVPVTVIAVHLLTGLYLLNNFENKDINGKPFNVAILAENIPPEMKWDENNGNMLVQKILNLNRTAVALKPNMALWSESAVPWTYKKDDDLVNEILSITAPSQVTHILGINTDYKDNVVFNSAYCILPNGKVSSRYDKQYLLAFVEKPIGGILMPFFTTAGFSATSSERHSGPLNTPYGKAGVFICNEAAVAASASSMVKEGAQFLFNISNDGWFNDTYIVRLHFFYARLRAVESRKDIAINSNNGYSGMVKASGEIVEQERSEEPFVKIVSIQPNDAKTLAAAMPNLFVYCCAVFIGLTVVAGLINATKGKVKPHKYSFKV